MAPLFGLLGLLCLVAALVGIWRPERVAFFISEPTRAKVVGLYLAGTLACLAAVWVMSPGGATPPPRGHSRSRYAMPAFVPAPPAGPVGPAGQAAPEQAPERQQ